MSIEEVEVSADGHAVRIRINEPGINIDVDVTGVPYQQVMEDVTRLYALLKLHDSLYRKPTSPPSTGGPS